MQGRSVRTQRGDAGPYPSYYNVADGNGQQRRHAKQASMWVTTKDLRRTAGHPFCARLNQILDKHDFDEYVEELCQRFYADEVVA